MITSDCISFFFQIKPPGEKRFLSRGDFNSYMKLSGQHIQQHGDKDEIERKIKDSIAPE